MPLLSLAAKSLPFITFTLRINNGALVSDMPLPLLPLFTLLPGLGLPLLLGVLLGGLEPLPPSMLEILPGRLGRTMAAVIGLSSYDDDCLASKRYGVC